MFIFNGKINPLLQRPFLAHQLSIAISK